MRSKISPEFEKNLLQHIRAMCYFLLQKRGFFFEAPRLGKMCLDGITLDLAGSSSTCSHSNLGQRIDTSLAVSFGFERRPASLQLSASSPWVGFI